MFQSLGQLSVSKIFVKSTLKPLSPVIEVTADARKLKIQSESTFEPGYSITTSLIVGHILDLAYISLQSYLLLTELSKLTC